jgi:hypothetical protein
MSARVAANPEIAAYARKVVASLPRLTAAQLDRISIILRPETEGASRVPTERDKALERARGARAALASAKNRLTEAMDGCRGCGLTQKVHAYQGSHGMGYHEWEQMGPDDLIATVNAHRPEIARLEAQLADMEAAL